MAEIKAFEKKARDSGSGFTDLGFRIHGSGKYVGSFECTDLLPM